MKVTKSILFLFVFFSSAICSVYAFDSAEIDASEKGKIILKKGNLILYKNDNDLVVSLERILENGEDSYSVDFGSAWVWPAFTLEMVESYTPFIFRTKISASLEEVKVILNIDNKGKLIGYKFLTEVDKGLEERMAHVLRKLPKCLPVPGYSRYDATDFELTIRK
ncbi:hypothetical protein MM236_04120 [Belliella sp. DSM 107340]|uniref:TonB C-terminal domain-containing protein n=1 Tax=Belliella calami TaxID=2923436 RepID=A0ABS9UKK7_9BACT|nr:hypothetical protein [Belliella calami]MCH7397158.1 hypothetical protein [Belliella calami]